MKNEARRIAIQILLFLITIITTTLAGAELAYGKSFIGLNENGIGFNPAFTWNDFFSGMEFSVPFLLILTVHEFGHYFTAIYHKIKTSLPYYIPVPPGIFFSIGTLGAVIRIRSFINSNIKHFDIGIAGPLAGFVVALIVLVYGFRTLPPPDYVYQFHPEYKEFGLNYADHVYSEQYLKQQGGGIIDVEFGTNLLFVFFSKFITQHPDRVPNAHELMHYPVLMAGFIALFITSLNLLPIGQLDGGHVVYGLFGRKGHRTIASVFFVALLLYAGVGAVDIRQEKDSLIWIIPAAIGFYYLCLTGLQMPQRDTWMYTLLIVSFQLLMAWFFPNVQGYSGWLVFAALIGRVLGVHHPPTEIEEPLDKKRQVLGWICLLIFITCFSLKPLQMNTVFPEDPKKTEEPVQTT